MSLIGKLATKSTELSWSIIESLEWQKSEFASYFDSRAWEISRRRLDEHMKSESIPNCLNAIKVYRGFGAYFHMKAIHNPLETSALAKRVQQIRPKVIVEIGTCSGGSLFVWTRSNPQAELIVSMDLPQGLYGGGYYAAREKMYRYFVQDRPQTRIELLRCNTHLPQSFERLSELLNGRPIDFLFIDGDHTLEGVRADFEMYSPLVRSNGIVAFHDINTLSEDHHVHRHWKDVKGNFSHEEIIADIGSGRFGIGLLTMPEFKMRSAAVGS